MSNVLSFSDTSLVYLKKTDLFRTVLPSKIFEAAAMERPIILGVEGESAALLRRGDAGICMEPENPHVLKDALIALADHPAERQRLGKNGREFVKAHFERRKPADDYLTLREQLIAQRSSNRQSSA